MSGLIIFPDAEDRLGRYLMKELAAAGHPVPVSTITRDEQGRNTPARGPGIRLEIIGGQRLGLVTEEVVFSIEANAEGAPAAIELANLVRALIHAAPERDAGILSTAEGARPYPLPDPRTGLARYPQTATVRFRGTAA